MSTLIFGLGPDTVLPEDTYNNGDTPMRSSRELVRTFFNGVVSHTELGWLSRALSEVVPEENAKEALGKKYWIICKEMFVPMCEWVKRQGERGKVITFLNGKFDRALKTENLNKESS